MSNSGGQRAAVVMSWVVSAKLNGHDPCAHFKNMLPRLPTHMNSRIDDAAAASLGAARLTLFSVPSSISARRRDGVPSRLRGAQTKP